MAIEPQSADQAPARELSELRHFSGPLKEFWPRLTACLAGLSGASKAFLLWRDTPPAPWKRMLEWPANLPPSRFLTAFIGKLESVAERSLATGAWLEPLEVGQPRDRHHFIAGLRFDMPRAEEACAAIFLLSEVSETGARESLIRLELAADAPRSYLLALSDRQAKADVEKLAVALDLMVEVNGQKHSWRPR